MPLASGASAALYCMRDVTNHVHANAHAYVMYAPGALGTPFNQEQSFHETKGDRVGKSAKTSATRNCLYYSAVTVVVNDQNNNYVSSFLAISFLTQKGDI